MRGVEGPAPPLRKGVDGDTPGLAGDEIELDGRGDEVAVAALFVWASRRNAILERGVQGSLQVQAGR